jgi:hypothetical protein
MDYLCRLPVGSGMGLTTSLRTLTLSTKLLTRFDGHMRHVGSNLSSRALPGDAFAPEDIFSPYLTVMQENRLPEKPYEDREERRTCEPPSPDSACLQRTGLTRIRAISRRRDVLVYPRATFVPRRIRFVNELVHCWRDGEASKGSLFALRLLQTAAGRKRLIPSYKNSWWVVLHQ